MRSFLVVIPHEAVDTYTCIPWCIICLWIYILIFYCPPEAFDKYIVICSPPVIHADSGSGIQEKFGVFWAGKVASLVGIHDLRDRLLKRFATGIKDKFDFHAVAYFPMEDVPRIPVDYGYEIEPVGMYWDVRDVY